MSVTFRSTSMDIRCLQDFDPIADGGSAAVDIRVFKDVRPAADGKIHLQFRSELGDGAFVSALELTPGIPGKIKADPDFRSPIGLCGCRRHTLERGQLLHRWAHMGL